MGLLDTIGEALDRPWASVGANPEQISANPWGRRGMVLEAFGQQMRDQNAVPFSMGLRGMAEATSQQEMEKLKRQAILQQYQTQQEAAGILAEQPPGAGDPLAQATAPSPGLGMVGPTPLRATALQQPQAANPNKFKADQYRRVASKVAAANPEQAKIYMDLADKLDPKEEYLAPVETADGFIQPNKSGGYRTLDGVKPKQDFTSDRKNYEFALSQGYKGSFDQWLLTQKKAGATSITNTIEGKGDSKFIETLAADRAKMLPEQYAQAREAASIIQGTNTIIEQSRKGTFSGPLAPGAIGAASFLSSLGIDVAPDTLVSSRLTEAVINDLVLRVTNAAGGARGFTAQEMPLIYNALPKLADDVNARIAVAQLLQRKARSSLNSYKQLRKSSERLPGFDIFGTPDIDEPGGPTPQPTGRTLDDIFAPKPAK